MCRALTMDELFEEVEDYIRSAMEILDRQDYLKLEGLEKKVSIICTEVLSLPKEETSQYVERMDTMVRQLDLLKQVMLEHKEKINSQLGSVDNSRRAHEAYAKSETMTVRPPVTDEGE